MRFRAMAMARRLGRSGHAIRSAAVGPLISQSCNLRTDDVLTSAQAARVSPPLSAALADRRLTPFTNALIEAVTMLPSMPTP